MSERDVRQAKVTVEAALWKRIGCQHSSRHRVFRHEADEARGLVLSECVQDVCLRCGKEFA